MNIIFFAFEICFTKINQFFVILFICLEKDMLKKVFVLSEVFNNLLQTFIFETQINMKWHNKRLLVSIDFLPERTFKYNFLQLCRLLSDQLLGYDLLLLSLSLSI